MRSKGSSQKMASSRLSISPSPAEDVPQNKRGVSGVHSAAGDPNAGKGLSHAGSAAIRCATRAPISKPA